jgi:hypothetical protein
MNPGQFGHWKHKLKDAFESITKVVTLVMVLIISACYYHFIYGSYYPVHLVFVPDSNFSPVIE